MNTPAAGTPGNTPAAPAPPAAPPAALPPLDPLFNYPSTPTFIARVRPVYRKSPLQPPGDNGGRLFSETPPGSPVMEGLPSDEEWAAGFVWTTGDPPLLYGDPARPAPFAVPRGTRLSALGGRARALLRL
jgi:hypothetical protein